MRYGFVIPGGSARFCAEMSHEAEQAGWDGVFIPDAISIRTTEGILSFEDPWVTLGAMAMCTNRVILGPMVTPVSRRRPWKLAREVLTLDHLSEGRIVLPVGLGSKDDLGFEAVGDTLDRKIRAELLDEGLAIIDGLWSGEPFSFQGKHYHIENIQILPKPVQQPRPPIWVVGVWPRAKSMRRILHWDGVLPAICNEQGEWRQTIPEDVHMIYDYVSAQRQDKGPFEIVLEGKTSTDPQKALEKLQPFIDAGMTWWIETMWSGPNYPEDIRARIRSGPPVGK